MSDVSRRSVLTTAAAAGVAASLTPLAAARAATLDPQSAALNTILAGPEVQPLRALSVGQIRRSLRDAATLMTTSSIPVGEVETTTTPSIDNPIPVRLYRPVREDSVPGDRAAPPPILLYIHGGYFVAGDLDTHDHMARRLCAATGALVVTLSYRLAPEHPFSAGLDDCGAVLGWLAERGAALGGDPARLGVCGDDAGGALAAGIAIRNRLAAPDRIKFLALMTPILLLDRTITFDSHTAFGGGTYRPSMADLEWMAERYAGTEPERLRRASPLRASSLRDLPYTLVISAGFDAFRDEAGFFVRRLREAAVPANERLFESTIHDFMFYPEIVPAARSAYEVIGSQFRQALQR